MKRMKRTGMKLGALALCACMLIGTMTACEISQAKDREAAIEAEEEVYHALPKTLSVTAETLATALSEGENYIEYKVQAVVLPDNAFNKLVDWSVKWGEGASRAAEPVTDYVTVVPTSDGSTDAHIRCMKGFGSDTIIITVTTRSGGFTADCTVLYEGVPTAMKITTNAEKKTATTQRGFKYTYYEVPTGSANGIDFTVSLTNAFGEVSEDMYQYVHLESISGPEIKYTDGSSSYNEMYPDCYGAKILSCSISGNTIHFTASSTIEGYERFESYYMADRVEALSVCIKFTYSGHSFFAQNVFFYLKPVEGVQSVSLTNSTVVF